MGVDDDTDELEILTEGPQSYLERAAASVQRASEAEGDEEEHPPKAEPGNRQDPVAGEIDEDEEQPTGDAQAEGGDEEDTDPLTELERKIAERQSRRSQQADPSETDQLRQQISALEAKLNERQEDAEASKIVKLAREGRWAELAQAAGHDPLQAYDGFTKQAADANADAAERRIAALEARLEERDREAQERAQRDEQEERQRQIDAVHRQAVRGWLDFAESEADNRPHLAALDRSDLARDGVHFAQQLAKAGEQVTYQRVAELIEAKEKRKQKRLAARLGAKGTKGADTKADAGDPRTISNEQAAQSTGADDRAEGRHDYLARAVSSIQRVQQDA